MKTIATVSLLGLFTLAGCANGPSAAQNASLQAEVNRCHEVMAQHATVDAAQDKVSMAYDWTVLESKEAWNSDAAVQARARLKAYMSTLADKAGTVYTNYTSSK
jgi:hypothetical protein